MVSDPPQQSASLASLSSPGRGRQRSARKSRCRPCWIPGRKNEAIRPRGGRLQQADEGRGGSATPAGEHMTRKKLLFKQQKVVLFFWYSAILTHRIIKFICSIYFAKSLLVLLLGWCDCSTSQKQSLKSHTYSSSGRRTFCFLRGFLGGRSICPV